MKVGFTGTQEGMTAQQKGRVAELLDAWAVDEFHHGDCIGADAEAHALVRAGTKAAIWLHPPEDPRKRAFCDGDVMLEPRAYLVRNRDIVEATDILVATPKGTEVLHSGTWSTVRHARRLRRRTWIVMPDGTIVWS